MIRRKSVVLMIMLILTSTGSLSTLGQITNDNPSAALNGGWLHVGGSGPGNYTTIQSAIDDANPGDTIFVYHGIYDEYIPSPNQGIVIIGKSITLIGEDRDTTIIDVQNEILEIYGIVIKSYTNNFKISRFTIRGNYQLYSMSILTKECGGNN